jgi:hypothetical protein
MPRVIKVSKGLYVQLSEADPEVAMREAQREYYEMPTPEETALDELLHSSNRNGDDERGYRPLQFN